MEYRVNPAEYGAVFVLPGAVVDRHLKMVGSAQLKVLLWMFRHSGAPLDFSALSAATNLSEPDLRDALQYWVEHGVVICDAPESSVKPIDSVSAHQTPDVSSSAGAAESVSALPAHSVAAQPSPAPISAVGSAPALSVVSEQAVSAAAIKPASLPSGAPVRREAKPAPHKALSHSAEKPTREEATRRGAESAEIQFMLQEVQAKFARGISQSEMSTLVWLHDSEGLSVPVILMVVEYALSQGRGGIRAIERIGMEWAERGITTIEQAEGHIARLARRASAWGMLESVTGIERRKPSPKEEETVCRWVEEWGFGREMLRASYDACVNSTSKFSLSYMDKILSRWHAEGVAKPAPPDAARPQRPPRGEGAAGGAKPAAGKRAPSFDIVDIESMLMQDKLG